MSRGCSAVLGVAILLGICAPVYAQEGLPRAAPEEAGLSSEGLDRITELMNRFVSEERIAGAVAGIARRGQQVYLEAVGYQDLEARTPMTDGSLFRVYSMTKAVTAVAAMILYEEGSFQIDDPVSMYLPDFAGVRVVGAAGEPLRPPERPITVRDLMLHTSGLSHRRSELYQELRVRSRSIPMARFIQNITAAPLMEDPGTRFRYSAASTVLGALVEVWSGSSLDEFLRARVFEPLEMNETGFWVEPSRVDRLTTVYRQDNGGLLAYQIEELPFTERPQLLEGAVGLVSTVSDFMRFSQMLLNRGELGGVRVLRAETVSDMTVNGLSEAVLQTRTAGTGWGLANVAVMLDPTSVAYPTSLGEYGWDGSAGTIFWVNPAEELVIVLMWQSSPSNPEGLRQQVKGLIHEALLD